SCSGPHPRTLEEWSFRFSRLAIPTLDQPGLRLPGFQPFHPMVGTSPLLRMNPVSHGRFGFVLWIRLKRMRWKELREFNRPALFGLPTATTLPLYLAADCKRWKCREALLWRFAMWTREEWRGRGIGMGRFSSQWDSAAPGVARVGCFAFRLEAGNL